MNSWKSSASGCAAASPVAFFDRPRKRNLTILFHVRLSKQKFRVERTQEIANVMFEAAPAGECVALGELFLAVA